MWSIVANEIGVRKMDYPMAGERPIGTQDELSEFVVRVAASQPKDRCVSAADIKQGG